MSYSTLKSELIKKKNVHITEKNPTGVVCVILNVKEPNSPYYKMVPTELQIKACESANRCKELTQCEKGVTVTCWKLFKLLVIIVILGG
jgi:hypothetical protein